MPARLELMSDSPLQRLPSGFRERTLKGAKLAGKLGASYLRRAVTKQTRERSTEEATSTARELVEELGALKGLVMKLGQIASYMPGAFPPDAQRVLAQLQSNTQPMEYDVVARAVRAELGDIPEQVFDTFERTPFAAASIGQVHRATHGGRDLAVKVQYPGIQDIIESDLKKADVLARLATLGTAFDGKGLARELSERILEECDYVAEARNQRAFEALFADIAGARVPEVVESRSGTRVLTTAFVSGTSFQRFCDEAPQAVKDRAAEVIFRTCFQSIFVHCIYNADPHPGNYLLHDEGDVTFLDFGCIREFDLEMIEDWKATAIAITDGDMRGFKDGFVKMGLVPNPDKFDWDHQYRVMQYIYRPYTEPGFRYTPEYVTQSYDLLIFNNPNRNRSGMPPQWLFLNRLQWGLNAILAQLNAAGPFVEIWHEVTRAALQPVRVPKPT